MQEATRGKRRRGAVSRFLGWSESSGWRKGWLVFVAAVMALCVVTIVWVSIDPAKPPNQAPAPGPGPAVPATAAPSATSGAGQGCSVPAGDTSLRPKLPADLRWAAANGVTWPVSDTYGPTRVKNGLGVCFAHSPLGAALMVATAGMATTAGHPDKDTIQTYTLDSPGKDAALAKPSPQSKASGDTGPISLAGFIVDSYAADGSTATVTIVAAMAKSRTGYAGQPVTLHWVDGDWKAEVHPEGTIFGTVTYPVQGQFIPWGGN